VRLLLLAFVIPIFQAPSARADSLKDLTGVWVSTDAGNAAARAACKKYLADEFSPSLAKAGGYDVIGICERGIEDQVQAIRCSASNVGRRGSSVSFTMTCAVKGSPPLDSDKHIPMQLTVDRNAIRLTTPEPSYFSANYIRCNRSYTCSEYPPPSAENAALAVKQLTTVPDNSNAKMFKSSAVKLGRTVSSIAFSRNATSYCSRPRLRSQPPRSMTTP
jgi:hypothetical protein